MNLLKEMLLIEEPSVFKLYQEMMGIAGYFVAPVFTIALLLEYFGEMNFGGVVKKLLLVILFMGAFYEFHTKAVEVSLDSATYTLKRVSPRNLFVKRWFQTKVRTTEKRDWNFIQSLAIPNLNDLLATAFFLLAKVFIWLLKLIYSSVYHLTYVFSGITAILFMLGWTKDALKGTVQASLWCMAMPFVIVAILALVGNSIDEKALGGELLVAKIDSIIWLFGVTLLLLISPVISYGMIKGDGIHSFGSKMGAMVVSSGMKAMTMTPLVASVLSKSSKQARNFGARNIFQKLDHAKTQKLNAQSKSQADIKKEDGKVNAAAPTTKNEAAKGAPKAEIKQDKTQVPTPKAKGEHSIGKLSPLPKIDSPSHSGVMNKETFRFNQKFWDKIHPRHGEAIKNKYGIKGNHVDPNKVHYPAPKAKTAEVPPLATKASMATKPHPQAQVMRPRKSKSKKEKFNEL